jgi:hypothetical protein
VEALLVSTMVVVFLVAVRPFYGVTADDAYISFRYAQSWAYGCGPVYSCGQPPVEGYTNFLWVAISALTIVARQDVVEVMRFLGLLSGALSLVVAWLLCRRLHGERPAALLPLVGIAASPFFAVNAVTGLETSAAILSVMLAALLSMELPAGRRPVASGLTWAASYLLRPEGVVFALLTALFSFTAGARRRGLRGALRTTLVFGVTFLAVAGPYFAWRVRFYGDLFPNTYRAKNLPYDILIPRNLRILEEHPLFFLALVVGALLALAAVRRAESLYLFLVAAAGAAVSFSVHNNFWMPGHRLYLTPAVLWAILSGGTVVLGERVSRLLGGRLHRSLPVAGPIVVLVYVLASGWSGYPETKELADLHYARIDNPTVEMGRFIRTVARRGDWLAIRDAGLVPFYAGPKVNVLDTHDRSLNDRFIVAHGWNLAYILRHDPRFVVVMSTLARPLYLTHPIEGQLLSHPSFRRYRLVRIASYHKFRHFYLYMRN